MDKKNLCDLDVAGQKVLVRVDYNVPMDETGKITDDTHLCRSGQAGESIYLFT